MTPSGGSASGSDSGTFDLINRFPEQPQPRPKLNMFSPKSHFIIIAATA